MSRQTANARQSPRCQHVKRNGQPCGSPALRGAQLCWQHREQRNRLPQRRPNESGVKTALAYVWHEFTHDRMPSKVAGTLLYALQSTYLRNA